MFFYLVGGIIFLYLYPNFFRECLILSLIMTICKFLKGVKWYDRKVENMVAETDFVGKIP